MSIIVTTVILSFFIFMALYVKRWIAEKEIKQKKYNYLRSKSFELKDAMDANDLRRVKDLVDKYPVLLQNKYNDYPLHYAASKYNNPLLIELLIDLGAELTPNRTNGRTALNAAIYYDFGCYNKETLQILLGYGLKKYLSEDSKIDLYDKICCMGGLIIEEYPVKRLHQKRYCGSNPNLARLGQMESYFEVIDMPLIEEICSYLPGYPLALGDTPEGLQKFLEEQERKMEIRL